MEEISAMAPRDTIVLLWDKGALILPKSVYPRQVQSAVVSRCLMEEISAMAPRDTIVLLWDKGAPILPKSVYPRQVQGLPSNLRLG